MRELRLWALSRSQWHGCGDMVPSDKEGGNAPCGCDSLEYFESVGNHFEYVTCYMTPPLQLILLSHKITKPRKHRYS